MLPGMDENDQNLRMYQHYSDRSQPLIPSAYVSSDVAARFRQPSTLQSSPVSDAQQSYGAATPGLVDSSQFAPSSLPGDYQYPQITSSEAASYSAQHLGHGSQYHPAYFYGQQPTSSADFSQQAHEQRYQFEGGRNASVASTSSLYSATTHQPQYFGDSQSIHYSARIPEVNRQAAPASFEHMAYTQPQGYPGVYTTSGQMLPPGSFGAYGHPHQPQTVQMYSGPDEAYETYLAKTREIFTLVRDQRLRETHERLLHISHYLLGNAEALGLDKDDKSLYDERLRLWDTFNHTWLTTLQAQLDLTQEMIASGGRSLQHPGSLLSADDMEELGRELVRLCDGVSVFGLIDYQMGVAEEHILEMLIKCLDLIAPQPTDSPTDPLNP